MLFRGGQTDFSSALGWALESAIEASDQALLP